MVFRRAGHGGVRAQAEPALPRPWLAAIRGGAVDRLVPGSGPGVEEGTVTRDGAHVPPPSCDVPAEGGAAYRGFAGRHRAFHPFPHCGPSGRPTRADTG